MDNRFASASFALMLALALGAPASAQDFERPRSPKPSRSVLTGQVAAFGVLSEDLQSDLGFHAEKDESGTIRVSKVRLGSTAYYGGLLEGDSIKNAVKNGNDIALAIARDGRTYVLRLHVISFGSTQSPSLASQTPSADTRDSSALNPLLGSASRPQLSVRLPAQNGQLGQRNPRYDNDAEPASYPVAYVIDPKKMKMLANFNMEFIVDRSLSMRDRDCPGNLSRWDWCGYQTADIAKSLDSFAKTGLTITPFAGEFDVYEHCTPQNIVDVFDRHNFSKGTRLAEPLSERIESYLNNHKPGDKPLLVTVITDGLPWPNPEPAMVRDVLIQESRKMTEPNEITVVFFQIGGRDRHGRDYLVDLGTNLTDDGATCQYVHTRTFEELEQYGLAQMLVDTVKQYAPPPPVVATKPHSQLKNAKASSAPTSKTKNRS